MITKVYKLTEITELEPAFDGVSGWLSITELNVIDPNTTRFDIDDDVTFEDGSVWVKVIYA